MLKIDNIIEDCRHELEQLDKDLTAARAAGDPDRYEHLYQIKTKLSEELEQLQAEHKRYHSRQFSRVDIC